MATKGQIITAITNHFKGHAYKNCYVGITSNVARRLHGDHNVPRKGEGGHWITRSADTNRIARAVEEHFLNAGMDGGGGGGDNRSKVVYAYKKMARITRQ